MLGGKRNVICGLREERAKTMEGSLRETRILFVLKNLESF